MIDDIIENDEYTIDLFKTRSKAFKDTNYMPAVHIQKSSDSLWYEAYKELAGRNDHFDINKKKIQIPELYWGNDKNGPNIEEMKKRYLFLAENSLFLLAPLIIKVPDGIYLANDVYLTVLIEKMLFGDENLEDTELFQKVMEYKEDSKYLEKVKEGVSLFKNRTIFGDLTNVDTAMFNILKRVRGYIEGQGKGTNKNRKLTILDEYFRIVRYSNDGRVWTSGYEISTDDMKRNLNGEAIDPLGDNKVEVTPVSNHGVGFSKFISGFNVKKYKGAKSYVCFGLSEKDKQEIYLKLHDELPWDLKIECKMEELNGNYINDYRLKRPQDTKPCGCTFNVKEGQIFVSAQGFYHLCSQCGFIVKVPNNLLSENMQNRIKVRCNKDKNLFRKMELLSELQALDDQSLPRHKVLFK